MTFQPGDRVAYSRVWLRNTAQYTGPLPNARGTVKAVRPLADDRALVMVHFETLGVREVLDRNLVLLGRLHLEPS